MAGDGRTRIIFKRWVLLVALGFGLLGEGPRARAAGTVCVACDKEIPFTIYMMTDAVKRVKVPVCGPCVELPNHCFLCGVAVRKDFTPLPDGRTICQRDVRDVVLDEAEARQICEAVRTGLFREDLMTTCVHEYAHSWVIENVSPARQKTLGKDAVEGFCELLAFLYAREQGLKMAQSNILANHYTRGQIHLFLAAEARYGLNDIFDWMKYGEDRLLLAADLGRVRRMAPVSSAHPAPGGAPNARQDYFPPVVSVSERLVLQGITWSPPHPPATISGLNFALRQASVVNLRSAPVTVRCEEITPTSVTVRTNGAPALVKLEFK